MLESYLVNRYQRVQLGNLNQNSNTVSKWTKVKHRVPQGSVLGPLLFLSYINDLPKAILHKATPTLFADDTSILTANQNVEELQNDLYTAFGQIIKRFQANFLSLNLNKSHFIQFSSKSLISSDVNITYENNQIPEVHDIKFLGLYINNTLSWKTHINNILPKLCSACFAMKLVKPYVSQQTMKVIYYSYFHSIMSYGILFWGHSAYSIRVFRLQKRIIRIMMGCRITDSCRKCLSNLKFYLCPPCIFFLFSVLWLIIRNYLLKIIKFMTFVLDNI
jgi:hypothetical protein